MEIGSILEFDNKELYNENPDAGIETFSLPFMNGEKYNINFYQNARNATEALCLYLKDSVSYVVLPDYVCSTVPDAIRRAGLEVKFYHLQEDFTFDINEINYLMTGSQSVSVSDCKTSADLRSDKLPVLYIVHFFGKPVFTPLVDAAKELMSKGYTVFEDITMSIFSKDPGNFGFGSYIIGSLRKWLPVPDGGFICSKNLSLPEIPEFEDISRYCYYSYLAQEMKRDYIRGGEKDSVLKEDYMAHYKKSIEYLFSDYTIYPVSGITERYISNYSQEDIVARRQSNYKYFYSNICQFDFIRPLIEPSDKYLPFGMIITTDNRDELLSFLVSNDIYCNVHWRLDHDDMGDYARKLSATIMTIPCDQRYSEKHFDRIISVLKDYSNKL